MHRQHTHGERFFRALLLIIAAGETKDEPTVERLSFSLSGGADLPSRDATAEYITRGLGNKQKTHCRELLSFDLAVDSFIKKHMLLYGERNRKTKRRRSHFSTVTTGTDPTFFFEQ